MSPTRDDRSQRPPLLIDVLVTRSAGDIDLAEDLLPLIVQGEVDHLSQIKDILEPLLNSEGQERVALIQTIRSVWHQIKPLAYFPEIRQTAFALGRLARRLEQAEYLRMIATAEGNQKLGIQQALIKLASDQKNNGDHEYEKPNDPILTDFDGLCAALERSIEPFEFAVERLQEWWYEYQQKDEDWWQQSLGASPD